MSDLSTGAYAPDDGTSKARQVAGQGREAATQAAVDVKETAKEQGQRVGSEAKTQARNVASDVRDKLGEQARNQNDKLVSSIRQTADHLDEMRGERPDSPAATVVSRVADGGRQLADYLDQNGLEGVLREAQDFARRRPGAFLATALAAGFVVGRLGKSVAKADPNAGGSAVKTSDDRFTSNYSTPVATGNVAGSSADYGTPAPAGTGYTGSDPAYPTGTEYATGTEYTTGTEYATTGTGTPVVVEETYGYQKPESRP